MSEVEEAPTLEQEQPVTAQPNEEAQEIQQEEKPFEEEQEHVSSPKELEQEQKLERVMEEPEETVQLTVENTSERAIEDEEMPSMVTISSPSKIDDSESYIKQDEDKKYVDTEESSPKSNPKQEEDNDSDSVCVIDDDDEEPEASSYDDDEESSSYRDDDDSVEMDRRRFNDNYGRRYARNLRQMDDEDDEEDEDEYDEEEGEEVDEDSEMDYFEGGSDDIILKQSNGFIKEDKERSASLQDLTRIKGRSPKNRHNVNPYSQKARLERNEINSERGERRIGKQYAHVESKVKKYIMDMAEQRRISGEKRKKAQEDARRSQEPADMQLRRDEVTVTCKNIKIYAEKELKEVAECEQNEDMYIVPHGVENGEISIFPRCSMGNGESARQERMDVDHPESESRKNDERLDKINGTVLNENQNNHVSDRKGILRREEYSSKSVLNGEDPLNPCVRTLTYEEYMKGPVNKESSENVYEVEGTPEKCNNNDAESPLILRIESVKSNFSTGEKLDDDMHNRKTPNIMIHQSTETYYQENPELDYFRTQLDQRNAQFENLREAYQKTISENLAMKMELQNLKEMLSNYQQQKSANETKVIAVQTEVSAPSLSMPIIDINVSEQQIDPKFATSMNSAMSSQWSDSIGSAAISMEPPPNITNTLNSDESMNQQAKTPMKQKNSLTRAFITSSKILQTLSNIAHGKTKLDKYINKRSRAGTANHLAEPDTSTKAGSSNPKKRKATDTMEFSSSAQPFKIPHITKPESEKDSGSNSPEPQFVNPNLENEFKSTNPDEEESENDDEVQVIDDDVKVFVYPEDDEGKEQSFLIQAKEITDNPKPGVRECGPYLLGNMEVYMTEMNGTINIWGKELSQTSTISQNVEELNTSTKSKDVRPGFRWQSTPRIFTNHGSASTSKKSKVLPRFAHHQAPHQHSCEMNNTALNCENSCAHNHRLSWPSCNQSGHEAQHTCCHPTIRIDDAHNGCGHTMDRRFATCCNTQNFFDAKRFSLPNVYQQNLSPHCCVNHNHCKNQAPEELQRHQTFVRRHSFNPTDEEEEGSDEEENTRDASKLNHSQAENSPHSHNSNKLVPPSSNKRKSVDSNSSDPSSCQNESDPLIFQRQNPEVPGTRKRKLRGKRVRGLLMDLLKGCGDCRTSNPINKTTNLQHSASIYEPSTSSQHRSCPSNQPSCSLRASDKCSACRNRNDKTDEIEAQLEFFRIEMEKLRSRSDTLRVMIDTLRKDDDKN